MSGDWRIFLDEAPPEDPNACEITIDLSEAPDVYITRQEITLHFTDTGVRLTLKRSQALVMADHLMLATSVSRTQSSEHYDYLVRGRKT